VVLLAAELFEGVKSVAVLLTVAVDTWVPAVTAEALIIALADFAEARSPKGHVIRLDELTEQVVPATVADMRVNPDAS
jgi:hypothetical protein